MGVRASGLGGLQDVALWLRVESMSKHNRLTSSRQKNKKKQTAMCDKSKHNIWEFYQSSWPQHYRTGKIVGWELSRVQVQQTSQKKQPDWWYTLFSNCSAVSKPLWAVKNTSNMTYCDLACQSLICLSSITRAMLPCSALTASHMTPQVRSVSFPIKKREWTEAGNETKQSRGRLSNVPVKWKEKCIHISMEVVEENIHIRTPTLSHTTNVIYSLSLSLASGNKRTGELRNTLS